MHETVTAFAETAEPPLAEWEQDGGPLTEAQRGIWYACNAHGDQTLYLTAQAIELQNADIDQLVEAIRHTGSEIEAFGHVFDLARPHSIPSPSPLAPNIRILQEGAARLPDTADGLSTLRSWMREDICMSNGPLHAHYIYPLGPEHCLWVCAVHHIAFDAYAHAMFVNRVLKAYDSQMGKQRSPVHHRWEISDLVGEERLYRQSGSPEHSRQYWRDKRLDGYVPARLFERSAYPLTAETITAESSLDDSDVELLFSGLEGHAAFSDTLLAAVCSYFSRINDSQDILFGFGMMGRLDSVAAGLPVTHANILPLAVSLRPGQSCDALQKTLGEELSALRKHQKYRGEWIARDYGRTANDNPLHLIEVHLVPMARLPAADSVKVESMTPLITGPVRDSRLFIYHAFEQRRIVLRLEAAAPASQDELRAHLRRLAAWIGTVARNDAEEIRALPLITAGERRILERWNSTVQALPETDIASLFEAQVAATPDKVALMFKNVSLTYRELDGRADRFAREIRRIIPAPRSVVAVAMDRSIELEVVLLALFKLGAAYMPVPADYPEERVRAMCHDAQVGIAIVHPHRRAQIPKEARPIVADAGLGTDPSENEATGAPGSHRHATNPAYVIFTSGSTGRPKGVLVEQRALVNRILWMQHAYPLGEADRVLQKTPYGFDVSVWELFWPLIAGSTLVMAEPDIHLQPPKLLSLIERERITVTHFVPSMLDLFVEYIRAGSDEQVEPPPAALTPGASRAHTGSRAAAASSLKRIFCSGEALTPETAQHAHRHLAAEIINLYGPTEAAIDVTHWAVPRQPELLQAVPLGRPIWNTKIHILDDALAPRPIGVPGEICIEGICLARGYAGRPELTAERFVSRDGRRLYRTGDVGRWNHRGEIEYLGRMDRQVKLRGLRIELGEIESVIAEDDDVIRAVAEVLDGTTIVAFIIVAPKAERHSQAVVDRIKNACRRKLPQYMLPRDVICVESFPYTANGKLDRRGLSALLSVKHLASEPSCSRTLLEHTLCQLFAEVLGVEKAAPADSFFDLGGDSLGAIKLAVAIQERIGWEVSIASVFSSPTPRLLAEAGGNSFADDGLGPSIVLRPPQNTPQFIPTLFCIHPAGGIAWCYAQLAKFLRSPCEIVGIQAEGLRNPDAAAKSMEQIAQDYAEIVTSHQKNGPYRLLGWSVGGMVAHAVACELQKQGHRVELLALMDSYPSDLWAFLADRPLTAQEEESLALAALLFIAGISPPGCDAKGSSIFTSPMAPILRKDAIALLRAHDDPLASLDDDVLCNLVQVVVNSRRIVSTAKHPTFDGDMLFFTAANPRAETWLDRSAWQGYLTGVLTNVDIDCDHFGLAREKAMQAISAGVDIYLEQHVQKTGA